MLGEVTGVIRVSKGQENRKGCNRGERGGSGSSWCKRGPKDGGGFVSLPLLASFLMLIIFQR